MKSKLSHEALIDINDAFRAACYAFVPVVSEHGGFRLGIAVANEAGYSPVSEFHYHVDSYDEASDESDRLNRNMGYDVEAAMKIVSSSMAKGRLAA